MRISQLPSPSVITVPCPDWCEYGPHTNLDVHISESAAAPVAEAEEFLSAHPDLYRRDGDGIRLSIHNGDLLTGSLTGSGFATSVHPDWSALSPLGQPKAKILQEQTI